MRRKELGIRTFANMKGESFYLDRKPNSPAIGGRKWFKGGVLCAGLLGVGVVTFLSLRSSPEITTVKWVPKIIANWADRHGRFCNFPAYGALAVPFLLIASTLRRQAWIIALLAVLIAALEISQLAIPTRVCDVWDIAWGWAGLLAAWFICAAINRFRSAIGSNLNPAA
jgi:hypothetical protein